MAFTEIFAKLETALNDATAKRERVNALTSELEAAQGELKAALEAVNALQAEYQSRLGLAHPELGSGVSVSG